MAHLAFVALAVSALVLGYLGLHEYLSARPRYGTATMDLLYWDLQLFVLDSDPLDAGGDLPPELQYARFAAPAATLSALFATAIAVMRNHVVLLRARYARRHTILCGNGHTVAFLARQLVADKQRVVLVDPHVRPGTAISELPFQVLRISGDPRVGDVLRAAGIKRAREVMALTPDSAFNGEVAVMVRTSVKTAKAPTLLCFAEVTDPELCAELAARALGARASTKVQVVFFSRHDRAARRLLDRHPVSADVDGNGPVAVLVVGDGELPGVLVAEIRRRWSRDAGPGAELLLQVKTAAEIFDLRTGSGLQIAGRDHSFHPPSHVYVCLEDDATAIRAGLRVSRLLRPSRPKLVVATPISTVLGRELADMTVAPAPETKLPTNRHATPHPLVLHNVTETVYTPGAVRRGDIDDIARAAHDAYLLACRDRGDTPETNPTMVPWDELSEFIQDDNRDQAADIGRKLAAIDATVVPLSDHETPFAFDDEEVELLAHMEHERWARRRRDHGWSHGPTKDEATREHPDLLPWADLSTKSQNKDRDAVREIPHQLRAAGFTIVRGTI